MRFLVFFFFLEVSIEFEAGHPNYSSNNKHYYDYDIIILKYILDPISFVD